MVRKRLSNQKLIPENKTFTLNVKQGWKSGTKITFQQEGDQQLGSNIPASDVVFIIEQTPHPIFQRKNNDLVFTKQLSIVQVLTGVQFSVRSLSGKVVVVDWTNTHITPNTVFQKAGAGMPISSDLTQFGTLVVKPEVNFEKVDLNPEQKETLRKMVS
jgi:DnaJ-class molecular chaperone